MSWSAKWSWKPETPGSEPAGARISAGKHGVQVGRTARIHGAVTPPQVIPKIIDERRIAHVHPHLLPPRGSRSEQDLARPRGSVHRPTGLPHSRGRPHRGVLAPVELE